MRKMAGVESLIVSHWLACVSVINGINGIIME